MLHSCSINLCQRGKGSEFFKKLFCQKTTFLSKIIKKILHYAYCNLKFWVETIVASFERVSDVRLACEEFCYFFNTPGARFTYTLMCDCSFR